MSIKVLLADDHKLFREGLSATLADYGMKVVAEASDGEQAVHLAEEVRPDVIIMDVSMPRCDGIEAAKILREKNINTPIVVLTMHVDKEVKLDADYVGVNKYLTKDCSLFEIVRTIRELVPDPDGETSAVQEAVLSPREIEVLQLTATGLNIHKIGKVLGISDKTVKNHLSSIYNKLGVEDRTQAVVKAISKGIVKIDMGDE